MLGVIEQIKCMNEGELKKTKRKNYNDQWPMNEYANDPIALNSKSK